MRQLLMILLTCACVNLRAQVAIITTIAGHDTDGYCGDDGPATDACLSVCEFLCLDNAGNIYIGDCDNSRIRRVDKTTGVITTVAGDGIRDYNGDNIPATDAHLYIPEGVCTDSAGNVYIADCGNNRVRKITVSTGIISTVAGSGPTAYFGGYSGDGGAATNAQLSQPIGVCVDRQNNIYIGDYGNDVVRRVDAKTGIITTFAGKQTTSMYTGGIVGYTGNGGPATNAVFSGPIDVFCDSIGNVFISDIWNNVVRKVDINTGIITAIAGNGIAGDIGDKGPALRAELNAPEGISIDKYGNLYIALRENGVVKKVNGRTDTIITVVGNDTLGFSGDGGTATNAKTTCSDVCVDDYGTLYITDEYNYRIRMVCDPKLAVPVVNGTQNTQEYMLWPNPNNGSISLGQMIPDNKPVKAEIWNEVGMAVYQDELQFTGGKDQLHMMNAAPGLYLLRLTDSKNRVFTLKFVVQ
ncbi:MAG: T9SS type A sorting domain-containing protein [Bacteroidetes bacterium]|nr:T9SS type A sorting domain-containing protein [Bacteroidota bacterium]